VNFVHGSLEPDDRRVLGSIPQKFEIKKLIENSFTDGLRENPVLPVGTPTLLINFHLTVSPILLS
jgi:hypothetical protein